MATQQRTKDKGIMYKMDVPEGLSLEMNETGVIKVKGTKGEAIRQLMHPLVSIKKEGNGLTLITKSSKKKSKRMVNSYHAHILNLFRGAKEKIDKDTITVDAANVETAGQTAANIEIATKIKGRDRRTFQDGIYIIEKPVKVH